jgi:uncharacterized membrane protein
MGIRMRAYRLENAMRVGAWIATWEADQLRAKANWLLGAVAILAIALVFYTLVESFGDRIRYVMVALGSLCMVAGIAFALFIEFRV